MIGPLRRIHGVIGILVVLMVLAFALYDQPKDDESHLLFPDLHKHINTVDQVILMQSGKTTTLKRTEGSWFVSEYNGIPVQFSTIRRTLMALAETKIIEVKTKNPKHYAALHVNDPRDTGAKAQQITLYAGNTPLLSLVMGKEEALLSGPAHPDVYIRLGDTVYWTRGALPFLADAKAYLDPVLWTLDPSRLKEISWVTHTQQGAAKRQTPFDTSWHDAGGAVLDPRQDVILQSILRQWSDNLTFSDIRPAASVASQAPAFTVALSTFDGFSVTLRAYQDAEKKSVWAMIQTQSLPAKDPRFWHNQKPKTFTGSVDLQPSDVVMSDIAELQAKVNGRIFRISPYPAEFLVTKPEAATDEPTENTKTKKTK
ncbi:MAG: DUF4340 domain-containing protein [Alphaproteobacteria bacterium]